MSQLLGANWKTSLFGTLAMVSLFVVGNPDLISGVIGNANLSKRIFSIAALIAGYIAFSQAKDKNTTGGTLQQDANGSPARASASVQATLAVTPIDKR